MSINVNYENYPNLLNKVTVTDTSSNILELDITTGTPDVLNFAVTEFGGSIQTMSMEKEDVRDTISLLQKLLAQMDTP